MIDFETADKIYNAAKSLRDKAKKHQALRDKAPDFHDVSPRKFNKHSVDLTWLAMAIEKNEFALHTEVVRAGICRPFEDCEYVTSLHRPSAFHTYDFKRPHPLKKD